MVPRLLLATGLLILYFANDTKSSTLYEKPSIEEGNPSDEDDNPSTLIESPTVDGHNPSAVDPKQLEVSDNPSSLIDSPLTVDDNPSAEDDNPTGLLSTAKLMAIEISKMHDSLATEFTCTSRLVCNRPVYYISSFFFFCYWILESSMEILVDYMEIMFVLSGISRFYEAWRDGNPGVPFPWRRFFLCTLVLMNQAILAYFIISKMSDMYVNPSDKDLYVPSFLLSRAHSIAELYSPLSNKLTRCMMMETPAAILSLFYSLREFYRMYTAWRENLERGEMPIPLVAVEREDD